MELDTLANGGGRGRTSVNTISDDPTGRSGKSKNAGGWRAGQGRAAVSEANEALTRRTLPHDPKPQRHTTRLSVPIAPAVIR